jgi:hypothetical protein
MSKESLDKLVQDLVDDPEFRSRLESEPTRRAKRRLIFEAGYDIDAEDVGSLRDSAGREGFPESEDRSAKEAVVGAYFSGMHVP